MKGRGLIALCLLLAALLGGIGLGAVDFWDDEANTALIGRNFMTAGSPLGWDGHNLASYGMRGSLDAEMRKAVPPLQYVLAGVGMALFGQTTAGARAIFLLIGLGAIVFAALWYREETGYENAWMVALILALCVPFLLYIQQVRYYAPGLLLTFAFLWSWAKLKGAGRFLPWTPLALLFLALLVLTNYLYAASALAMAVAGFLAKDYRNRRSLAVFGAFAGLAVLAVAWAWFYSPAILHAAFSPESGALFNVSTTLMILKSAPLDVLRFEFLPAGALLFCLPALWFLGRRAAPFMGRIGMLLVYCAAVVAPVALFSPQADTPYNVGMRYCIAIIPLGAALGAAVAAMLSEAGLKRTVWVFLFLLVSSNVMTLGFLTDQGFQVRMKQYLEEKVPGYSTGSEAIGVYIEEHIPEESCIFMVPTYTSLIQMYYHPRHTFCGMVSVHSTVARHNRDILRESLFFETTIPDYFIIMRLLEQESRNLLDMVYGEGSYRLKDRLYVYGENLSRPEIPWRSFGPITPSFPGQYQVFVFERSDAPAHVPSVSAEVFEKILLF